MGSLETWGCYKSAIGDIRAELRCKSWTGCGLEAIPLSEQGEYLQRAKSLVHAISSLNQYHRAAGAVVSTVSCTQSYFQAGAARLQQVPLGILDIYPDWLANPSHFSIAQRYSNGYLDGMCGVPSSDNDQLHHRVCNACSCTGYVLMTITTQKFLSLSSARGAKLCFAKREVDDVESSLNIQAHTQRLWE